MSEIFEYTGSPYTAPGQIPDKIKFSSEMMALAASKIGILPGTRQAAMSMYAALKHNINGKKIPFTFGDLSVSEDGERYYVPLLFEPLVVRKINGSCTNVKITTSFLEIIPDKCGYVFQGLEHNGTIGTFLIGQQSFNRLASRMIDRLKYTRQQIYSNIIVPFVPKNIQNNVWLADVLPKEQADRVMRFECLGQLYRVLQLSLESNAASLQATDLKFEVLGDALENTLCIKCIFPNKAQEDANFSTSVTRYSVEIKTVGIYLFDAFSCIDELAVCTLNDLKNKVCTKTPAHPKTMLNSVTKPIKAEVRVIDRDASAAKSYASSQGLNVSAVEFKPASVPIKAMQIMAPIAPPRPVQVIQPMQFNSVPARVYKPNQSNTPISNFNYTQNQNNFMSQYQAFQQQQYNTFNQ